ncbi:MAG: ATP-binding protein [Anaerolineae bacterium]
MQVEQAFRTLVQLKGAAPPTTAARLGDVIALLRQLEEENDTLHQQILAAPPPAPPAPQVDDLSTEAFAALKPSLHIVQAQAEAMRAGRLGRITTEQADCLKLINEHAATTLSLIESLDTIRLVQQGLLHIEQSVFSPLDVLAEVWQRHNQDAEQREHHINIHADDPIPPVVGDRRFILTILSDMLDNAIRYTPFGGMIRVRAETLGTHVLFSIADNGIGLNSDDMLHIGEPFWRARHQALVRQNPGTGLRLHIARLILELHGSDLLFSGEPSMGSTFSFMLAAN